MISEKGYWIGHDQKILKEHCFDQKLAIGLVDFFKNNSGSIVDLGCGPGNYTKFLKYHNFVCDGYDGNPDTPILSNGICNVLDLSDPVKLDKDYDWVLSLEVGEHLPPKYENIFITNLHNNNKKGIILSWAVEGQGGHGHFNCRNNNYIKNIFKNLGYNNDTLSENYLRMCAGVSWFKNTIMVFRKN